MPKKLPNLKRGELRRRKYGPLSFWFLNHELEEDELSRQIISFKDKGFAGFFLHARSGLLTPYRSQRWFDALGHCIREAKRLGLEAWLYDEDPYPSGMAGGEVTLNRPELRASYLRPAIHPISSSGRQIMDLPAGQLMGAFLVQGKNITSIKEHAGIVRTEWSQPARESYGYYPPYVAEGSPHWRVTTLGPHFRICLDVEANGGFLVAFIRQYAPHHPWGEYADLLNPDAVSEFIRLTHQDYARRFGREFGKTIPGFFTDEPKAVGTFPWSDTLPSIFKQLTGSSLVESLPHLAMEIDDRSTFLRWAYRESISKAFKTAYIEQIETFCRKAGLAFTGHISPEEDPVAQAIYAPNLLDWIGGMTIPGADLIGAEIGDERHTILHIGQKVASSAAHTRGKRDVLCEAFAVVDWVQDMPWMGAAINWLYALGVNMLTTHGQFYSIDGLRKREAPPSQFFHVSYWEHFGALSCYVETLSRELTRGRHSAPVALYFPAEEFMADSPVSTDDFVLSKAAAKRSEKLRESLGNMVDRLLVSGYDFDFVDESALASAKIKNGRLVLNEEEYHVLLLPGKLMTDSALRTIRTLEKAGLKTISTSPDISSLTGRVFTNRLTTSLANLTSDLSRLCAPVFRTKSGRLIGHKRKEGNTSSIFLVNNGDETFHGTVELDFPGPYAAVNLQTGQKSRVEEPIQLEIESRRGILIRQEVLSATTSVHANVSTWRPFRDLSLNWTAKPNSENCLLLGEFRILPLSVERQAFDHAFNERFVAAERVNLVDPYTNKVRVPGRITSYWTSFECSAWRGPLHLVRDSQLGPPAGGVQSENFRFFINGNEVTGFKRRRRYDCYNLEARIDRLLRQGRNFLVMEHTLPEGWSLDEGLPYDGLRIFGDFHLEFPWGHSTPARITRRPACYKMITPAPIQHSGHPHYAGLVVYSRSIDLGTIPNRIGLKFEKLHESAEIFVNGISAGVLWQPPHFLEVSSSIWRAGRNLLEVRCSTSAANYLQGLAKPSGFTGTIQLVTL